MAARFLSANSNGRAAALHTQNWEQALPLTQFSIPQAQAQTSGIAASNANSQPGTSASAMPQQQQGTLYHLQQQHQRLLLKAKQQQLAFAESRATQQQQQQAQQLLQKVLALRGPSSSSRSAATTTSISAGLVLAAAIPRPGMPCQQYSLLTWAGGVLSCSCHSAYLLAQSMWQRVDGKMDELLLLSLGVSVPSSQTGMLLTLWIASKLEGQRRHVAGTSRLATTLQLLPWAVTNLELHIMQLLEWRPYAHLPAAAA
jgi:hypothetical protein